MLCFVDFELNELKQLDSSSMWFLNVLLIVGNLVAVYTPRRNITACEITSNGKHIILAHEGFEELVTLQLRGPGVDRLDQDEVYGTSENNGRVFELESDVCWPK